MRYSARSAPGSSGGSIAPFHQGAKPIGPQSHHVLLRIHASKIEHSLPNVPAAFKNGTKITHTNQAKSWRITLRTKLRWSQGAPAPLATKPFRLCSRKESEKSAFSAATS